MLHFIRLRCFARRDATLHINVVARYYLVKVLLSYSVFFVKLAVLEVSDIAYYALNARLFRD
jgi:hypothetical protein